eukprot:10215467-Alexandrium_andersonii.AAC.1
MPAPSMQDPSSNNAPAHQQPNPKTNINNPKHPIPSLGWATITQSHALPPHPWPCSSLHSVMAMAMVMVVKPLCERRRRHKGGGTERPVSYTHLTLPTICSV